MRDRTIDTMRGILTVAMVYGHVLQFFGDSAVFPGMDGVILIINLMCFPGFLFCFGRTIRLSYLSKPWKAALPGMIRTTLRLLFCFCVSGIAYRVLRENKPLGRGIVMPILLLQDLPGWSEFLATFALMMGVTAALFPLLKRLKDRPYVVLGISTALTCAAFLPYQEIHGAYARLWIGGNGFACFPVVQYLPYLLMGMVCHPAKGKQNALLAGAAGCVSLMGILHAMTHGIPERFPPHWAWLAIPWAGIAALVLLADYLHRIPGIPCRGKKVQPLTDCLGAMGSRSLFYLLGSNLVLFTLSGKGLSPLLSPKAGWPWHTPIQSPLGSVSWTAILFLTLMGTAWIAGRGVSRHTGRTSIEPEPAEKGTGRG